MSAGRAGHTATLLKDGRVLIAGGWSDGYGDGQASADIFDPETGSMFATGSMTTGRSVQTATLLQDGRVLMTGGFDATGTIVASAELYDPLAGTFTPTGSMTTARAEHSATVLTDGRVLIAGGIEADHMVLRTAELYDPAKGTFSATGNMTIERGGEFTATRLNDGRVLLTGGCCHWSDSSVGPGQTAELYDPRAGTFTATGSMTREREGQVAVLLPSGKVLVAGGADGTDNVMSAAELYDPSTGSFTATGSMTAPRLGGQATVLLDGRVLVTGGDVDVESYTTAGGFSGHTLPLSSADIYDPSTGAFTSTGSMGHVRVGHTSTLLDDGRVLIAGGWDGTSYDTYGYLSSAEIYTP